MSDAAEFMTTDEVGAELGRSIASVRAYIRHYGLPVVRRGGRTFIRRDALAAWRAEPANAAMLAVGDHLYARRKAAATA